MDNRQQCAVVLKRGMINGYEENMPKKKKN